MYGAEHWILFANGNLTACLIDVELEQTVVAHVAINQTARRDYTVFVLIL